MSFTGWKCASAPLRLFLKAVLLFSATGFVFPKNAVVCGGGQTACSLPLPRLAHRHLCKHSLTLTHTFRLLSPITSAQPLLSPLLQSIDPGQQFTWENSNMEVNKPKNRYANVIAYDHSRVVLTSVDGKSPSTGCW